LQGKSFPHDETPLYFTEIRTTTGCGKISLTAVLKLCIRLALPADPSTGFAQSRIFAQRVEARREPSTPGRFAPLHGRQSREMVNES
jgi:hypothetical protein